MKMIPDTPHGTFSQAEKRVFDRLRAACTDVSGPLVAYHSLNLTRHAYKRFGEIDFLICGPQGIFVLEVKGGSIACKEGVWQFTNRYGETTESVEGPFRQAESALHGLMTKLKSSLSAHVASQFTIGFGVVFPDCELRSEGAEWDSRLLADARGFRYFEGWLLRLFSYWRNKDGRNRQPDSETLKELCSFIRPEFEAVIPLHVKAHEIEVKVATLTEDQMVFVDVMAANPRVICSGGAGTGKTFLAMELARRWTSAGMKVVLICRSPWLRRFLQGRCAIPGLVVTLVETMQTTCRREGIERFDALIIDEGQDLFDMASLSKLDATLKNGMRNGRWCFFCDINNQSGLFGEQDRKAVEYLHEVQPARVPLGINCRNTRVILEKVKTSLGADMGVRGAGQGPSVREYIVPTREAAAEKLASELREIIEVGGIAPGDVTILSPLSIAESSVNLLNEALKRDIAVIDEYALGNFPLSRISFAKISSFKGLENAAVIVVDLEPPHKGKYPTATHYVAMSRARAVLSLIYLG